MISSLSATARLATAHALLRLSLLGGRRPRPLSSTLLIPRNDPRYLRILLRTQALYMAPNGSASRRPEESCCGVVQEAREKSAARREKPQPWLVRKLTIFITLGIIGYAFYVYIARLCLPMIRQDARALGGRAMGSELRSSSVGETCIDCGWGVACSRLFGCFLCLRAHDAMGI